MKHKHYDMIVAWAEGKDIQWNNNGVWHNLIGLPNWYEFTQYRIKPEPNPNFFQQYRIDENGIWWFSGVANLRLHFDGETKQLKSAEVLK